jgi:hypothetical protein
MSESDAAGKLTKIPGIVEAAATKPVQSVGVPRLSEKGLRTGLFDIVELRIAKNPMMHRVRKTLSPMFLVRMLIRSALKLREGLKLLS